MLFSVYLVAPALFLAQVHAQGVTTCEAVSRGDTYQVNSQVSFDEIETCLFKGLQGINGNVTISSQFDGVLDFGNISSVMGMVSAVNANNFTGISGQNLVTIGQDETGTGNLELQNLSNFNSLDLPLLYYAKAIVLSDLPQLTNLSLPGFLSSSYNNQIFGNEEAGRGNLTVDNTGILRIERFNMNTMDSVTLTNNPYLNSIDLSSLSELGGNLIVSNNGPSLDLDISHLVWVGSAQLSNVQIVSISSLVYSTEGIELSNNTFTTIDLSALRSFGNGGFVVKDNLNLISLDSLTAVTNKDNDDEIGLNTFIEISNNPQLIFTGEAFGSLAAVDNITIYATINGTNLFTDLYLNAYTNFMWINITSINPTDSNTAFSCAYLDQKIDTLWVDKYPDSTLTPPSTVYTCASYTSANSTTDIAKHYTPKRGHKSTHLSTAARAGIAVAVVATAAILLALAILRARAKRRVLPKPIEEDGDELPEYTRHAPQPPAYQGTVGAAAYISARTSAPEYGQGLAAGGAGEETPSYVAGDGWRGVADEERHGLVAGEETPPYVDSYGERGVADEGERRGLVAEEGEGYRVSDESVRDPARREDRRVSLDSARPVSGRG